MDIGITIGRLCDPSDSYGLAYWTGWTLWHVVNAVIYVVPFGIVVWIVRQITVRLFGMWWQVDVINGFLFGLVLLLLGPMTGVPSMLADMPEVTERGLTNPGFFMLAGTRLAAGVRPGPFISRSRSATSKLRDDLIFFV